MVRRLLLWDLDGTLLTTSGLSREAFHAAVSEVLNREIGDSNIRFDGKTDPMIARELLIENGVPPEELDGLTKKALRLFGPQTAARRKQMLEGGHELPGVRELLIKLDEEAVLNTVLTGNLAVNAVLKLDLFKLAQFLDIEVGAYGSDRAARSELVGVALERAKRIRKVSFDDDQVWVIGDTPGDFHSADDNGVHSVLVATGRYSYEELADLKPDLVLHDLCEADLFYDKVMTDK